MPNKKCSRQIVKTYLIYALLGLAAGLLAGYRAVKLAEKDGKEAAVDLKSGAKTAVKLLSLFGKAG